MLRAGDTAPLFQAESTHGRIHLQDYLGKKNVLLIFYPRDDTPICTQQLCAIQETYTDFLTADTVVFGVNQAEVESHERFSQKFHYQFPLISDEDQQIRKLYDVKKIIGLFAQQRIVYIIDKTGMIFYAKKGNPGTAELLQAIHSHEQKTLSKP